MKRKADAVADGETNGDANRPTTEANGTHDRFGPGLFDAATVKGYASSYATSEPYKHAVVSNLISDPLLRSVRTEILDNIHFTPKETDIYKIHQSGDLANLDGLDPSALSKLPSLLKLRDSLYGPEFRQWIQDVSGAGALSGRKTDMAVNVYVPGCHLLCHDDVIGSRRVSYILYLTDPEKPWQAEWGGALRLYSTDERRDGDGKVYKVPRAAWSKAVPPAWNQLSFFAVQPGESFHDVEEVYHRGAGEGEDAGGRVRMAISGWFHIPQEGEEGYEPGLEEKMAEMSSLQQLQGKADQCNEPQAVWFDPVVCDAMGTCLVAQDDDEELSERDLEFLLRYMKPNYLTPDTVEELNELFAEESTLQLTGFLNQKFADRLREQFEDESHHPMEANGMPTSLPPYKHRYQYLQPAMAPMDDDEPHRTLLCDLLPSLPFRKWLAVVTGLGLKRCSVLARRFRRGLDYQLAQGYESEEPQLEYTLCVTPTLGWGAEEEPPVGDGEAEMNGKPEANGKAPESEEQDEDNVGGYELYMAGDDDPASSSASDDGIPIPASITHQSQSHTGAGDRRSAKRRKADPAVCQAAADDDDDDGILFSNPASWNTMSIVLRDRGTLKFVKYVSRRAEGDRWDFTGAVEVVEEDEGGGDGDNV